MTIVIDGVIRRETSPDLIEIRGVENVVLVGAGAGAEFDRVGIRLTQSSNVTLRKVHVPFLIVGEIEEVGIQGYVDNAWIENTELDAPSDADILDYRKALAGAVNQYATRT